MFFLNFWYFWFLPLLAIPFLLNLWKRRQIKTIEFPYFPFLQRSRIRNITFFKLLNVFLLLLRFLFILLLIMIMSRPVIKTFSSSSHISASIPILFVLDNSPSMGSSYKRRSLFKQSKMLIEHTILQLNKQTPCAFLTMNKYGNQVLHESHSNPEHLIASVRRTDIISYRFDIRQSIQTAQGFLTALHAGLKELRIYTDNQRSNWTDLQPIKMDPNISVNLITPAHLSTSTIGWQGIRLPAQLPKYNNISTVTALLQNFGTQDWNNIIIRFFIGSHLVQQTVRSIKSQELIELPFEYEVPSDASLVKAKFSIQCADFAPDNTFNVILRGYPHPKFFLVGKSIFLKTALESYGQYPSSKSIIQSANLESLKKMIQKNDTIIYLTSKKDIQTLTLLKRKASQGTTVIVFYSPQNSLHKEQSEHIKRVKINHPIFSPYKQSGTSSFKQILTTASSQVPLFNDLTIRTTLLETESKNPFLEEIPFYAGRIFLFHTDANAKSSNLVTTDIFLPLLHRIIDYALTKKSHCSEYYNRRIGDNFILQQEKPFSVNWITPAQQSFALNSSFINGKYRIDSFPTPITGYYILNQAGKKQYIAYNLPQQEGNFRHLDKKKMIAMFTVNNLKFNKMFTDSSKPVNTSDLGLTAYLLIAGILLSCIELIISNVSG